MTRRGEHGIWQRRYWEHTIRDERDFRRAHGGHAFQPGPHPPLPRDPRVKPGEGRVREGEHPVDWPHSSFRRCVAIGLYPAGWTGGSAAPGALRRPRKGVRARQAFSS